MLDFLVTHLLGNDLVGRMERLVKKMEKKRFHNVPLIPHMQMKMKIRKRRGLNRYLCCCLRIDVITLRYPEVLLLQDNVYRLSTSHAPLTYFLVR